MKTHYLQRLSFFWALQTLCNLHRKPYSATLAEQQSSAPFTSDSFIQTVECLGFVASHHTLAPGRLHKEKCFPVLVMCATTSSENAHEEVPVSVLNSLAMVLRATTEQIIVLDPTDTTPRAMTPAEFDALYRGVVLRVAPAVENAEDEDSAMASRANRQFGFSWFVPELRRHKRLWQEILLASLVIQLIALATPLFTQAIIDKVVVHRTESTLIVVVIGMAVFMLFSAGLSWLRQYLVLHTGNRIDAVLGSAVFERLFKLPPLYFQHRPTGVISEVYCQ
jgi:subfamily B ATP-binding cassette protein HlyB/CyaB